MKAVAKDGMLAGAQKLSIAVSAPPKGGGRGRGFAPGGRHGGGRDGGFQGGRGRGDYGGGGRDGAFRGGRGRGGRGDFGGGRGRGGPGEGFHHAGRGEMHERGLAQGGSAAPHQHQKLVLDAPSGPAAFVPRAVAVKDAGAAPKSNSDFRNMFLKKDGK